MAGSVSRLTEADFAVMAQLREAGVGLEQIGQRLGCSGNTVAWHCLRLGVEAPKLSPLPAVPTSPVVIPRGGHVVRRFTTDEDARITAMAMAGDGNSKIGRAVGRPPNSIKGRLMTLARHEARAEACQEVATHG